MPTRWEKVGQTKPPLSSVISYFMNPENELKSHPKLVREIKNINREGETVTWEQTLSVMGMNLRSTVRSSLNRATNTIETESIGGSGKGTRQTRAMKEIPTGTEVLWTYDLKAGALGFFIKGRGKKAFEETVDRDIRALDDLT